MERTAEKPTDGDVRIPLPALLGETVARFASEFDRRLAGSEFPDLSLAHSRNVLRHLGAGPRRASSLVAASGVTKQALSQQIAHLDANGFLSAEPDPSDHRARLLTLTDKGVRAQALVWRYFIEIEESWGETLGCDEMASLRRVLTALVKSSC